VDGVLVPGGFGYRGIPGKIEAVRYARERGVPFFGICLGLQCAVIEFARNVVGLEDANTTEIERNCPHPVVCLLDEQYDITQMGGTMRLGSYPCALREGSRAHRAYGSLLVHERHRHRYEFNNHYREQFEGHGMLFSGTSPDGHLVEVLELPEHPWFVAVQCHPEFKSKPTQAHPLFKGFLQASLKGREQKKALSPRANTSTAPWRRPPFSRDPVRGIGTSSAGLRHRPGRGAPGDVAPEPSPLLALPVGKLVERLAADRGQVAIGVPGRRVQPLLNLLRAGTKRQVGPKPAQRPPAQPPPQPPHLLVGQLPGVLP
jgi:hypothetical protein